MYLREKIIKTISKSLKQIEFLRNEEIEKFIEPSREDYGDFACSIAFNLAKKLKKSPFDIANDIVEKIEKEKIIEKVEAKNGYVNFFLNYEFIAKELIKEIRKNKENYGRTKIGKGKKIMVEFSQPNPVHPMHIGHARTTLIGDSLSNILEFNGYKVIRANYMNDVGLQVAKLVTAYKLWGNNKKPEEKADLWLWKFYVKFHEEAKNNKDLEDQAREMLRKFELLKDKNVSKLWRKIVNWCIDGFKETYKKIDVDFDIYFYESDYRDLGKKLVFEALKKNIAFKSDQGTIVANLEKVGLPNFVLLRSDGTGLYQTSDLGLTVYKFKKYKLNKSIWVVSAQQNLYFKQLFKILELLGFKWSKDCYHLSFEHVILPEGKMSSREGRVIMLDDVIDKLTELALKEVEKRNPKIQRKDKYDIAKKIATSALRYWILRIDTNNIITFDWEKMLSFDGNTGPYLMYAYTRCNGILKKVKIIPKKYQNIKEINIYEKKLLKSILQFTKAVEKSAKEFKPSYICNYLYDLSTTFTEFYHNCKVIDEEDQIRKLFRIYLVLITKIVLENSFKLIGIKPTKIM
ncbi:MAG: arginine--tRNA ligase [Candidatus Aenigmatarchaeota archaeon]